MNVGRQLLSSDFLPEEPAIGDRSAQAPLLGTPFVSWLRGCRTP
jgi:hypothetical protein